MMTAVTIQRLASKQQTTELNIYREYMQHLFLSYFYQQPHTDTIFFKGETALRIIYQSPRFSEDLDFSAHEHTMKHIEDAVLDTIREIEREGIQTEIVESKKTSGGYLAILDFALQKQMVSLHLEISFRSNKTTGELATIASDFIPPYTLMQMLKEQLIAEKMNALIFRRKPRDFYDFYFILRANLLPVSDKKMIPGVLKILLQTDINFDKELKRFLPKSHWPIIRDFKATLIKELERR